MILQEKTVRDEVVQAKRLKVSAYTIPTSSPESDGTIEWDSTTLILVTITAGNQAGIGYTYASIATAVVIEKMLQPLIIDKNVMDIPSIHANMIHAVRNQGNCGIAMMAVSALDNALWDLKAKLLELPLSKLIGSVKDKMLLYGSGGFTSYSKEQLQDQFSHWTEEGMKYVKMKIGRDVKQDVERVKQARQAIGDDVDLFVDANGAYTIKQAIEKASQFADSKISWFEEPVTSDNLDGLRFIREQVQPLVNVTAGEYGYNLPYFKRMLEAKAVDILQADATRCGGITDFLKAGHLAEAYEIPFSSHCAPMLHLAAALALPSFFIAEYFHDHARIESMLFDGFAYPKNGYMKPDLRAPGLGFEFKYEDAEKYKQ
jgi:L-alanine-DL-glutamate epimerase-like enolase superfamily enzyme